MAERRRVQVTLPEDLTVKFDEFVRLTRLKPAKLLIIAVEQLDVQRILPVPPAQQRVMLWEIHACVLHLLRQEEG